MCDLNGRNIERQRRGELRSLAHAVALLTYEIFLTYSRYYTSLPREESFYLHELRVLKGTLLNPESSQTTYHARRFHLALFRPALIPPYSPPSLPPVFFLIFLLRSFILSNGTIYSVSRVAPSFRLSVPLSFFFPFLSSLSLFLLFFFCPRIDNERRYIINANKIAGIEYPRKICKEEVLVCIKRRGRFYR